MGNKKESTNSVNYGLIGLTLCSGLGVVGGVLLNKLPLGIIIGFLLGLFVFGISSSINNKKNN
ncbi:hypothetical protein [Oceanirhabdus sp. W0125-5]|uniref:hypothetical protein n=1 Tax=Oceanirhabdus sp. W0125-5 TaxID=2999116 RepID=UPI0022F3071A|nr:hypothetical protein [Oceanirhabdus sp. W0125-5]WBW96806.1 hypothetical protein OW730_24415 [Oceanirhabdus sp. W0125-5]